MRSASNLPPSTTWLPASSAVTDHMNGPLWYSGPGHHVRAVDRHHQQRRRRRDRSSPGPVREDQLRPAGAAARRHRLPRIRRPCRAAARRRRRRRRPAARQARRAGMIGGIDADDQRGRGELDDRRRARASAAATRPAAASRRASTHAIVAATNSTQFGSAIVTMSPCPTPSAANAAAVSVRESLRARRGSTVRCSSVIGEVVGIARAASVAVEIRPRRIRRPSQHGQPTSASAAPQPRSTRRDGRDRAS